jgi:methanogenic corrinoid protein MtbC1
MQGYGSAMSQGCYYDAYLAALLGGDRAACARVAREALDGGVSVKSLYADVFRAALYTIGDLWQANQISVATEHLATAITEAVMSRVVAPELFAREPVGRSIIVSCVVNEFHQIGGRMVADIAEMHGWDSYFLGANTPVPDLVRLTGQRRPDVVGLSVALSSSLPALHETIGLVREIAPGLPVWLGGQIFRHEGHDVAAHFQDVSVFHSLDDLESALDRFAP